MKEKRRNPRMDASIDVVLSVQEHQQISLKTSNLSKSGVFLLADGRSSLPEPGELISLSLGEFEQSEQSLVVQARIARKTDAGIGIEYVTP